MSSDDKEISYAATDLCQGDDQQLLVLIAGVLFPGRIEWSDDMREIRIWVTGEPNDDGSRAEALHLFRITLGVLRAWNVNAGVAFERLGGLGGGAVRDRSGNQWMSIGHALMYVTGGDQVEVFAQRAKSGISASINLPNALWLHGRAERTAADY